MRHTFLVGRFLPGYSSAYHYKQAWTPRPTPEDPAGWAVRRDALQRRVRSNATHYHLKFEAGLVAALFLVVLAFRAPYYPDGAFEVAPLAHEMVALEEIQQTRQQLMPPPPPRPPIPVAVPDDVLIEDDALNLDASLDIEEVALDQPPPLASPAEEVVEDPEVFVAVEQMPKMIGGAAALSRAVSYPPAARKQGVEGIVVVRLIINEDGVPSSPEVYRSAGAVLDRAAVEAVMQQRFEPGRQRGRAVKVQMAIPVQFRLTR